MTQQVNWIKPLILATILLILGSVAYWVEFNHKPKQEAQEEQSKKVFALKDTAVQSVKISGGTVPQVELTCSDLGAKLCKPGDHSKWELKEPLKATADEANANSLLSSLNQLNATETIDLKEETPEKRNALLKEYGLDAASRAKARQVVVRTGAQGDAGATVLYLGATHPIGEGIFGLLAKGAHGESPDESKVYLIPSHFKSTFEHDLTYWRNKKLFTLSTHEIGGFELKSKLTHLKGAKRDGLWTLTNLQGKAPEELAGDLENIEALLTGATFLSAKDFVSNDKNDAKAKATLKGAKPVLNLTLAKEKDATPLTLQIFGAGAAKPQAKTPSGAFGRIYATVSNLDPLFELEPTAKDRLDKELKDLRLSKLITTMDRYAAKRLEFTGKPLGAQPLLLTQVDGKWVFGDKSEADNEKVQATLDKLSGNRVKEFLSGKNLPKGEAEGITLTLGDDQTAAKRKLVFWKQDGKLYARDLQSKREEAFLVDSAVQEGLPWAADHFKKVVEKAVPTTAPAPKK